MYSFSYLKRKKKLKNKPQDSRLFCVHPQHLHNVRLLVRRKLVPKVGLWRGIKGIRAPGFEFSLLHLLPRDLRQPVSSEILVSTHLTVRGFNITRLRAIGPVPGPWRRLD